MKKLLVVLCALAFTSTILLTSCKKYEDGPAISLLTKKSRLTGDWKIESVTINDVDQTAAFNAILGTNYQLSLAKDGTYKVTGNFTDEGTWKFGEDKDDYYSTSNKSGATEQAFRILRLKSKELWVKQTASNGDVTKVKYKQ